VTPRYKIIGTICIDPQAGGVAPPMPGFPLEHVLLSLAVTDALADTSAWQSRCRRLPWNSPEQPIFMAANLDALVAELQTAWDELETGAS
jgi:hypothetical protein